MGAVEAATYLLFWSYLLSFFALTSIAQHKAGRPVWLFGRGKVKQALPSLLFRLAFFGAVLWPLVRLIHGDMPADDGVRTLLDSAWIQGLGLVLVAVGAAVAIVAQRHMGKNWRIGAAEGETGAIVVDGPFALSRNPVFMGQALLFLGLFLVFPGFVSLALIIAMLVAIHLQVGIEEHVLAQTLGEPYRRYMHRVPRWIGRIGP